MNTTKVFRLLVIRALVILIGSLHGSVDKTIVTKWLDDTDKWMDAL